MTNALIIIVLVYYLAHSWKYELENIKNKNRRISQTSWHILFPVFFSFTRHNKALLKSLVFTFRKCVAYFSLERYYEKKTIRFS